MPASWSNRWAKTGEGTYVRNITSGLQNLDDEEVAATAAAEKLAQELGVDLASVEGSGKGGKVTVGDVKAAAE